MTTTITITTPRPREAASLIVFCVTDPAVLRRPSSQEA